MEIYCTLQKTSDFQNEFKNKQMFFLFRLWIYALLFVHTFFEHDILWKTYLGGYFTWAELESGPESLKKKNDVLSTDQWFNLLHSFNLTIQMEIGHSYLLDPDFAPLVHKLMLGKDDNYSN